MSHNLQIYTGIAIFFLLVITIAFFFRKKKQDANNKIDLALKPYTQASLQDLVFPDGVGGMVDIERLVLLKQGVLVIETYPMSGNLFGADKIEKWTQMLNGKSFKFTNPLYRIQMLRQAIQVIAPSTPIFYRVIFTASDSSFPKGKPDDVSTLLTLENDLEVLKQSPVMTEKQRSNWDRILRIARKDGQAIQLGTANG
ncbi:MAG: NERD domain-containing protein [Methylophaga sp.]|nr:NERD domain-containing protein [Methylophaga sp.]